jgi:hypothetical protein
VKVIDIPSGFATLLGAIATLLAGSFVIIGAIIAWRSVQRQIKAAEQIESNRRESEISIVEAGFTAEMIVYSRGIIEAASIWNERAVRSPNELVRTQLPVFQDPLYYRANIGKIGLLRQQWVPFALIGFYANLLEINEQSKETLAGRPTVNSTTARVAARLQIMASSLAQALDGLNNDKKFPIQPEIRFESLFMPDGKTLNQADPTPTSLQEVLLRLGEGRPLFVHSDFPEIHSDFPENRFRDTSSAPADSRIRRGATEDEKGCRNCPSGRGHGPIWRASGPSPGLACRVWRAEADAPGAFGSSHAK